MRAVIKDIIRSMESSDMYYRLTYFVNVKFPEQHSRFSQGFLLHFRSMMHPQRESWDFSGSPVVKTVLPVLGAWV